MDAGGTVADGVVDIPGGGSSSGSDNNGAGRGVQRKRSACSRNDPGELAGVYDGGRKCGGGGLHVHSGRSEWKLSDPAGSERGSDADEHVLHGGVPPERWDDEPAVLGDSDASFRSGPGEAFAGREPGASDQCGDADGEQELCGRGDCTGCDDGRCPEHGDDGVCTGHRRLDDGSAGAAG